MPTIQIAQNYRGYVRFDGTNYVKSGDAAVEVRLGAPLKGQVDRGFERFPLASLPAGATVTLVRARIYVSLAGGAAHLGDIHPYGSNGQPNPETDDAATCYTNTAAGTPYIDDTIEFRTVGTKWFSLPAQACTDVMAAKTAVNRFSLGFHEEGDNDAEASCDPTIQDHLLEITYTVPAVARPAFGDGFTWVQLLNLKSLRLPYFGSVRCL